MAIGVGVSDSINDALGRPLVENNDIDPAVFIDDDGQAYLYWGNPDLLCEVEPRYDLLQWQPHAEPTYDGRIRHPFW